MKRLISTLFLIATMGTVYAQKLTPEQVKQNAQTFAKQLNQGKPVLLEEVAATAGNNLYCFNLQGGGFVIATGDSRALPVVAYSSTESIDPDNLPDGFRYWMSEYALQMELLESSSSNGTQPTAKERPAPKDLPASVAPMLVTSWTQSGYGYNSLVPFDSVMAADSTMRRFQGHPTVGCAALSMAQIMRYWQYPVHGVSSHSYSLEGQYECWRYGTLSADFAHTTYDYAHMPYRLTDSSSAAEVEAVATIASHCGISSNMQYNSDCRGSSGAQASSVLTALQRYFHYSPNAYMAVKNNYDNDSWITLLKQDLASGRPIFYCGQSYENASDSTVSAGHAFVLDGYDSHDYFHVNWGWHGSCDGYYAINALRPLTQYNFSTFQYCILGVEPSFNPIPILAMAEDLTLDTNRISSREPLSGNYLMTNLGDTAGSLFFGVNIYGVNDNNYYGCVDGRRITLQPGDTVRCHFSYSLNLPEGEYYALMQYSTDSFYAGITDDRTFYYSDPDHAYEIPFRVIDTEHKKYSNLALFVCFADDPAFTKDYTEINRLFNGFDQSISDYFDNMSYGFIQFNTVYANQRRNGLIVPYIDPYPRGYYQPYSEENPIGYTSPNPTIGISMREAQLIERVCRYVDSLHLVNSDTQLDGDDDGDIDNLSIILQGNVGRWADLLWPHMEFFPHDSIGYTLTINGKRVNAFNFEFEGSYYFSLRTFAHEMGHSLGLPDLYHYFNHTNVAPVHYDIMASTLSHPSAIYKHRFLNLTEAPIQITHDGTYTINALNLSPSDNLYYIKSSIDSNQWYTIEYRVPDSKYETSIPSSGLVIGRWFDTAVSDIYHAGNAFYDYYTTPNTYWVFRPDSDNDSIQGNVSLCYFSSSIGRTSFGPATNPHPYLADGTPEQSFEIYDIEELGETCSFSVRFLSQDITGADAVTPLVYPNPTTGRITLHGIAAGTPVHIYNTIGAQVIHTTYNGSNLDLSSLPQGLYMLATPTFTTKIIKQ